MSCKEEGRSGGCCGVASTSSTVDIVTGVICAPLGGDPVAETIRITKGLINVCWRGRPRPVPHTGEGIGEQRPDESLTVLQGADAICERRLHDDVVGDDATRFVAAA
jgi:hypothetical protein